MYYTSAIFVDSVNLCQCDEMSSNSGRCVWLPRDCEKLRSKGIGNDGLYSIYPSRNGELPMDILCNMTHQDGGWTVCKVLFFA